MSTHNFVLIGEAGSGKTEIAANLALRLAEDMPVPVCLMQEETLWAQPCWDSLRA